MIKQFVLILLLSAAGIFFKTQLVHVLDSVVVLHNYIARTLHTIFSDDKVGRLIQDMVSLLILPLFAGLVIATVFWLIKRSAMPHTMGVIWVFWLVLFTTMLAQSHMGSRVPSPVPGAPQNPQSAQNPVEQAQPAAQNAGQAQMENNNTPSENSATY